MAKTSISDWSTTSALNADVGSIDISASGNVSQADDAMRNIMRQVAEFYDSLGAVNTVGGTASAITVTIPEQWAAYATGQVLAIKLASAITGATTINVTPSGGSALGAKAIRTQADAALGANDGIAGGTYLLRYDAAFNSAAGAFVLLNPTASTSITAASTTEVLTGTDATKYATSDAIAALWEKGADIASATTISIGEGGYFHITGTTAITDIDWATATNGRGVWLIFDGVLTLTYHATTLTMPGAASITTAAGDAAYVIQDAADNAKVLFYQRADGTSVVNTSGQPVPTSSTLAVGSLAFCLVTSAGGLADGATIAGASVALALGVIGGGSLTPGAAQTGTWKNVSGSTIGTGVANSYGWMVRTA